MLLDFCQGQPKSSRRIRVDPRQEC